MSLMAQGKEKGALSNTQIRAYQSAPQEEEAYHYSKDSSSRKGASFLGRERRRG